MVISSKALIDVNNNPTEDDIKKALKVIYVDVQGM